MSMLTFLYWLKVVVQQRKSGPGRIILLGLYLKLFFGEISKGVYCDTGQDVSGMRVKYIDREVFEGPALSGP